MKKPVCLLLLMIVCLAAPACQKNNPDAVVFSVGGAPSELDFWETIVKDFEKKTGIPVRMLRKPSNTSQQLQSLVISLKAEMTNPDVFLMDVAWVGLFTASDWLAPLGDKIDTAPFFEEVISQVDMKDGKLIALPVYMDGGLLYYRKDLLAEAGIDGPPETWEELRESAQKVQKMLQGKNQGFYGYVWSGAQYEGLITAFMEFAGSEGGFVKTDKGFILNTPANVRALKYMRDLIWKYNVSPEHTYTSMREEEVRTAFQEGDALYERNWPYAWPLHQAEGSPVKGVTGVAPPPAPEGAESVSTLGGFHIGVSKYSDLKDKAIRFVEYVTSSEVQKRVALKLGWNPGRQDLYENPEILAKMPHFEQLKEVFARARPRPLVPYYIQLSSIAQKHINRALADQVSAEEALAAADEDIAAVLKRYGIE